MIQNVTDALKSILINDVPNNNNDPHSERGELIWDAFNKRP